MFSTEARNRAVDAIAAGLARVNRMVFIPPEPYLIVKFSEVPLNDDFISPAGALCRKRGDMQAEVLTSEEDWPKGTLLTMFPYEQVEYVPIRPAPRVAYPGYIPHLMESCDGY